MSQSFCRSCYRPIRDGEVLCAACDRTANPKLRWVAVLGVAGLPLLAVGVLTLNVRACVIGAAISGIAALIYAALSLR